MSIARAAGHVLLLTTVLLAGCAAPPAPVPAASSSPATTSAPASASASGSGVASATVATTAQPVQVLAEIPHDPTAFTQGLEVADGVLYEGTGIEGRSQLRTLDPATGAVRGAVPIPAAYFGEGITVVDDRIWQLTWQSGVALEWDRSGPTLLREVAMDGEGWGLCRDGDRLVRSDGTDRLRFHDPVTFAESGAVSVTLDGAPLTQLNELECVDGKVWANVWQTDRIVRIDPADGRVEQVVDAAALRDPNWPPDTDVLNGIAHLDGDEFLVTGKLWPSTFRVRLPG